MGEGGFISVAFGDGASEKDSWMHECVQGKERASLSETPRTHVQRLCMRVSDCGIVLGEITAS